MLQAAINTTLLPPAAPYCPCCPRSLEEPAAERAGAASPSFQLFLLTTLARNCLPRIQRKRLHFFLQWADLALRWAAEVLPELPAGRPELALECLGGTTTGGGAAAPNADAPPVNQPLTVVSALTGLAACFDELATDLELQGQQEQQQQEVLTCRLLLAQTLLALASMAMQLSSLSAAASASLRRALAAGPRFGNKLVTLLPAAAVAVASPAALLARLQQVGVSTLCSLVNVATWDLGSSMAAGTASAVPEKPSYLSPAEVAEGAALAVAVAVLATADARLAPAGQALLGGPSTGDVASEQHPWEPAQQGPGPELLQQLATACPLLLDAAAGQKSVLLTLVPLVALGAAVRWSSGGSGVDAKVAPALQALLAPLVAIMSCHPVELVRSCAHEALHCLLDALAPAARLDALRVLLEAPSSAAAVVALQRLRQEAAAAWPAAAAAGSGAGGAPAGESVAGTAAVAGQSSSSGTSGGGGGSSPFLTNTTPRAALALLEHGGPSGWAGEGDVLARSDAMAAALALLRFLLLREAAAPLGLLGPPGRPLPGALDHHLLPLRACVSRLLAAAAATGASGGSTAEAVAGGEREAVEGFLGLLRLQEALDAVVELLEGHG